MANRIRFCLLFLTHRSDPCRHAVITAKGENHDDSIAEALETALAPAAEAPKATKKASAAKRARTSRRRRASRAKKASPPKKAPKGAKKATGARDGSKTAKILDLLKRKDGAPEGTDEGHGLAGAFRARLPLRDRRQEDGPGRHVDQGGGRGAHLLRQSLIPHVPVFHAPLGDCPAAFFVGSGDLAPAYLDSLGHLSALSRYLIEAASINIKRGLLPCETLPAHHDYVDILSIKLQTAADSLS